MSSHATKSVRPLAGAERVQLARMPALIILVYAAAVHVLFLAVLGYAVGFFAGFGVPKGIDQGTRAAVPAAVATDLLLLSLFAVQHTVMARPWFKRRWTRIVPGQAERTTFVVAAALTLALLFWLWRPVGGTVRSLSGPAADALRAVYAAGWAVAFSSTFLTSHFDLFGPRQARPHVRGYRDRATSWSASHSKNMTRSEAWATPRPPTGPACPRQSPGRRGGVLRPGLSEAKRNDRKQAT
jgi:hypothetical protein